MEPKPLTWTGSSWKDLKEFPVEVQRDCGYALHQVQIGNTPPEAKALKGIGGGGASVMEIVLDHHRDTYRAVYTAKMEGAVYVLHCFQKKSKRGIATPKPDINTVERNLKTARELYRVFQEERR